MRLALAAALMQVWLATPTVAASVEMAPPTTAIPGPPSRAPADPALCLPAAQASGLGPAAEKMCQAAWAEERAGTSNETLDRFVARYGDCHGLLDLTKMESDRSGAFSEKPAVDWTSRDLTGALRYDMRCRHQVFPDRIYSDGRPDPQSVSTVYQFLATQVAQAKLSQANAQAVMRANEQAAQARQDSERRHVAELTADGYRAMSVSDLQLDGRSLVGSQVAVRGFVFVIDDEHARISSNSDDVSGVSLDVSRGNRDVRRFLFANCSSLSKNCRIEIRATVISDDGRIGLRLD